ncbi:hypothetical protein D3C75_815570 [compost metagenome]
MQGHEPEMTDRRTKQWIHRGVMLSLVKPGDELGQLIVQSCSGRCLKMHDGAINTPRDNLHRLISSQLPYVHWLYRPFVDREQPTMPLVKSFNCQWLFMVVDGIQHHGREPL